MINKIPIARNQCKGFWKLYGILDISMFFFEETGAVDRNMGLQNEYQGF